MSVVSLFHARNHLVAALSPAVAAQLEPVQLAPCSVVLEPGTPPTHVWFPEGCIASLLLPGDDGAVAQAAMIGQEGMLGVDLFLGGHTRVSHAITLVHVGGLAWRLSAPAFQYELARNVALRQRLLRYTLALVTQMARSAACRRAHTPREQVARWLQQTLDRSATLRLGLGAESIANLLGLRRADVADALAELEAADALRVYADALVVTDRERLETRACGCYRGMRQSQVQALQFDHPALGQAARQHAALRRA